MPSKLDFYSQMADHTAKQVTGSFGEWTAFLETVGRLYKYPFHEQLMIFAQKPNATACADYDLWNKQMGRYVRRGSKGIALIDTSGDNPRLKFYNQDKNFSDTMIAIKSQSPKSLVAEIMESENKDAIIYMSTFADMADETLSGVFTEVSINITPFATNKDLIRALGNTTDAITPNDLESGSDVFICIEEHKLEQWKSLLTMIVNQFCKFFEQRKNDNTDPILFMLDEFPRLGKIESVSTGLATLRSKKIEIMLYVQSKNQLDVIYGEKQAGSICDNCTYKAILKASEPATQKWCSDLVGTYDKQKKSSSTNTDNFGIGSGSGVSTTTEEKRIMKPEEFAYMQDVVCIFPSGYSRITKIKYWEDRAFSNYQELLTTGEVKK